MSSVQTSPSPGLPSINELVKKEREKFSPEREVFIFSYKRGHAIISINFQADSLMDAVREAKEVCRVKKWTWIGVTPFLRDIKRLMEEE